MLCWSYWVPEHSAVFTRYYITITSSINITLKFPCSHQVKKKSSDTLLAMKEVRIKTAGQRW